jgi:hypothetical protein
VSNVSHRGGALTANDLLERSAIQLDELFRSSSAGRIPEGQGKGTVVLVPGSRFGKPLSWILGKLFWRGKAFHPNTHDLQNEILPFGVRAIRAQVYRADSWLDGRPCVVLDYSKSSKVAGWIRDEIREIAPDLYLGIVWGIGRLFTRHKPILRFALTFPPGT